jgi:hypothetical protein
LHQSLSLVTKFSSFSLRKIASKLSTIIVLKKCVQIKIVNRK